MLARGECCGFVAVDADGKVWSLLRWCGVETDDLRARLGSEENLPTLYRKRRTPDFNSDTQS